MDSKKHDLHFMAIVLVLAFFIMILSIDNMFPEMAAAQVTYDYEQRTNFLVNMFKSSDDFNVLNPEAFSDIRVNLLDKGYSIDEVDSLLGGNCEWVNIGNSDYNDVRLLTGYEACKHKGFESCIMTNKMLTTSFYESKSTSCEGLQLEQISNKLGSCTDKMRSVTDPCVFISGDAEPRTGDYSQQLITTVLCCR